MEKTFTNVKIQDLEEVSIYIKENIKNFFLKNDRACIIYLEGDLGAGKTTFTKQLAKDLDIKETVISPTFILRKDYENLIHIDGYRFENKEESKVLELEKEINQKEKVILIEWPYNFVDFYSLKPDIIINFSIKNETERDISIKLS